jgi:hypothetical protein
MMLYLKEALGLVLSMALAAMALILMIVVLGCW